jgi:hypothetical protein
VNADVRRPFVDLGDLVQPVVNPFSSRTTPAYSVTVLRMPR